MIDDLTSRGGSKPMPNQVRRVLRAPGKVANSLRALGSPHIIAVWARGGEVAANWGDKLNPDLIALLSGRSVLHQHDLYPMGQPIYGVVGSMLASLARKDQIAWGCGFLKSGQALRIRPRQVLAVRGIRSVQAANLDSRRVALGDPALLCPLLYSVERSSGDRIGVIPHFRERTSDLMSIFRADHFKVIDITGGLEKVQESIAACRTVLSSSLHGLILADAYGVPNSWIHLDGAALGDGFKFQDYLATAGRTLEPMRITDLDDVQRAVDRAELPSSRLSLSRLIEACPFVSDSRRAELSSRIDSHMPDYFA